MEDFYTDGLNCARGTFYSFINFYHGYSIRKNTVIVTHIEAGHFNPNITEKLFLLRQKTEQMAFFQKQSKSEINESIDTQE